MIIPKKLKKQDNVSKTLVEVENRLYRGDSKQKIATDLKIPLYWVTESEMDMEWCPNFNRDCKNEA
jgi:hypothetical protein